MACAALASPAACKHHEHEPWSAGWQERHVGISIAKAVAQHYRSSAIVSPAALRGLRDERDDLLEYIASVEKQRDEDKVTLETQITRDEDMLSNAQTKRGSTTEKEATAGETARQTAAEDEQTEQGLIKSMKTCSMFS